MNCAPLFPWFVMESNVSLMEFRIKGYIFVVMGSAPFWHEMGGMSLLKKYAYNEYLFERHFLFLLSTREQYRLDKPQRGILIDFKQNNATLHIHPSSSFQLNPPFPTKIRGAPKKNRMCHHISCLAKVDNSGLITKETIVVRKKKKVWLQNR